MLEQQIEHDLKNAMLAGDKRQVLTLRGIKSVLLYAKVAAGKRDEKLSDAEVVVLLTKEAKKRQESADLYMQGGSPERAEAELTEKTLIEAYLPAQLSEQELVKIVDDIVTSMGASGMQDMGKAIGAVKTEVGPSADGATIARLVKERLGF